MENHSGRLISARSIRWRPARPIYNAQHVTLKAKLVDASTGELFGALSIPFEVH